MSGTSKPGRLVLSPTSPDLQPFSMECPHCRTTVHVAQTQGDRCPGCHFEFTWFDPGQDLVAGEFYRVLTGDKYVHHRPGGGTVVVHG